MSEKKIVINIDDSGNIDAETFNFTGISCVQELDKILKDLSMETKGTKKPEFYKEEIKSENIIQIKK